MQQKYSLLIIVAIALVFAVALVFGGYYLISQSKRVPEVIKKSNEKFTNAPTRSLKENFIEDYVGINNIIVGKSTMNDVVNKFGSNYNLIEHKKYSIEVSYEKLGLSFYYSYNDSNKVIFSVNAKVPYQGKTNKGITIGKHTIQEVINAL